jgi:hypothetical protein
MSSSLIQPTCNLVKVTDAKLEHGGQEVAGVFGSSGHQVSRPTVLCEDFLNANSPESILRFTKRYGPLFRQYRHSDFPVGLPFRFAVEKWQEFQYDIKSFWGHREADFRFAVGRNLDAEAVEEDFVISKKGHKFVFADLSRLILFFVHFLDAEMQRACARPECRKFFFATRLDQTYCGDEECKQWGKRRSKRDTWNRNKEKYTRSKKP